MKLTLKIVESDAQIQKLVLNSLVPMVQKTIVKSIPSIKSQIRDLIINALKQEPEYSALVSGKLKAEFGIPQASQVNTVVQALADTINITANQIVAGSNGLKGGFSLTMMKSDDLGGAITIDAAHITDTLGGYSLPWLEWLLLRSNDIIVRNYEVRYTSSPRSRSGMALMYESKESWRVPPEFAGSQNNNWTTRAVDRSEKQIYDIIKKTVEANV